jgi:hypothetical protein
VRGAQDAGARRSVGCGDAVGVAQRTARS